MPRGGSWPIPNPRTRTAAAAARAHRRLFDSRPGEPMYRPGLLLQGAIKAGRLRLIRASGGASALRIRRTGPEAEDRSQTAVPARQIVTDVAPERRHELARCARPGDPRAQNEIQHGCHSGAGGTDESDERRRRGGHTGADERDRRDPVDERGPPSPRRMPRRSGSGAGRRGAGVGQGRALPSRCDSVFEPLRCCPRRPR
jgi:hypothetical protein